jgi:hypothetical protein
MRGSTDGAAPQQPSQPQQQQQQAASEDQAQPQAEAPNGDMAPSVPIQLPRSSPGSPRSGRETVWPVTTGADCARD